MRGFWANGYQYFTDAARLPVNKTPLPLGSWIDDDFTESDLTAWTITTVEAGSGNATETFGGPAGILTLTNDDALNDSDQIQRATQIIWPIASKDLIFKCRWSPANAATAAHLIGLAVVDTSLIASAPSDGIYFETAATGGALLFTTRASSTGSGASASITLVDDQYYDLAFRLKTSGAVDFFVDNVLVGSSSTNVPAAAAELVPSFAIRNGGAAVKAMSIDYYSIFQER
jgi:hypothetical protein